jgi:hypothetical protein
MGIVADETFDRLRNLLRMRWRVWMRRKRRALTRRMMIWSREFDDSFGLFVRPWLLIAIEAQHRRS